MKTLAPESLSAVSQTALWGWLSSYNIRKLGHSILETTRNKAPCDGAPGRWRDQDGVDDLT